MAYKLSAGWICVTGGIVAVFMAIMDIQITNVAIGDIQSAMQSTLGRGSWISSSYLIAEVVCLPLTGLFLQVLGLKRYAIVFLLLFLLGSVLCAQASSFPFLVAARGLQGFAGGALMAYSYVLIIQKLPNASKGLAITIFGAILAFAPVAGPILAGYLTEYFSWRALFYINIPIGIIALAMILIGLSEKHPTEPAAKKPRVRVHYLGIITVVIGLICLQFVLEEGHVYHWFQSDIILWFSVTAAVLLPWFVWLELRADNPLVNFYVLQYPRFLLAAVSNIFVGAAMYGGFFLIPFYLIEVLHYRPLQISQLFIWVSLGHLLILPMITRLTRKYNHVLLISAGFLLFAVTTGFWALIASSFTLAVAVAAQVVRGLASPLILNPLGVMATSSVPDDQAASASILFNIFRSLGGAFGLAILRNIVVSLKPDTVPGQIGYDAQNAAAFGAVFTIMSVFLVFMACVYLGIYFRQRRSVAA